MNQGNFLELLHYTAEQNEEYRLVALETAPGHDKLIAPNTISLSLKMGIETLFSKYNLSISRLRGQDYDGASNMRALVAVAKEDTNIERLFLKVSCVINIIGWSPRHQDLLNDKQVLKVKKGIESGELSTGQGLNQDISLKRPRETRWGSNYGTLLSLINLFSSVIEVLEDLTENSDNRVEASDLVDYMTSFDFAFNLHMMKIILGITFELSQALQRKDQNIINVMSLVHLLKRRLLLIRNNGWDNLLDEVSYFCIAYNINVPNM
ncbi:uncharacterized protein LOC116105711 [Pistacia vera]|uniref:uncharacterized protein LOC116105711 n=1 Tax=Pistacia vera TaxID=55513 RepID=UPI0012630CD3|nr:uncharacterized protein LOC116105711 [Pistacia vera]